MTQYYILVERRDGQIEVSSGPYDNKAEASRVMTRVKKRDKANFKFDMGSFVPVKWFVEKSPIEV